MSSWPIPNQRRLNKVAVFQGAVAAEGLRVGIVVSRFNEFITRPLLQGALETLARHGVPEDAVDVAWVPGAVEIPVAAQALARTGEYGAVITLGAVIRGATTHYDYVCSMVANGVNRVALDSGIPVIFGVLTTDTIEQAIERAGSKAGNKGSEAAVTAVEMASLLAQLGSGSSSSGS
mgnify:CR=1 FL=1